VHVVGIAPPPELLELLELLDELLLLEEPLLEELLLEVLDPLELPEPPLPELLELLDDDVPESSPDPLLLELLLELLVVPPPLESSPASPLAVPASLPAGPSSPSVTPVKPWAQPTAMAARATHEMEFFIRTTGPQPTRREPDRSYRSGNLGDGHVKRGRRTTFGRLARGGPVGYRLDPHAAGRAPGHPALRPRPPTRLRARRGAQDRERGSP
jgi:hypothetical protein